MEIIRKIIKLHESRSYKPGLLPFVPYNSGITDGDSIVSCSDGLTNYGGFVCDFSGDTGYAKYLDLARIYNDIQVLLRDGILLKKRVGSVDGEKDAYIPIDLTSDVSPCDDEAIEDVCIYDYVPYISDNFIYKDPYYYSVNNDVEDDNIILLRDFTNTSKEVESIWKDLTGDDGITLIEFCKNFEQIVFGVDKCGNSDLTIGFDIIPTIDIPILLENNTLTEELYYPYEYSVSGISTSDITINNEIYTAINGESVVSYPYVIEENSGTVSDFSGSGITILVDSKLESLISEKAQYAADGIFGIYEEFSESGGCLFECTFYEEDSSTTGFTPFEKIVYKYYSGGTFVSSSTITNRGETVDEVAPLFGGEKGKEGDRIIFPKNTGATISGQSGDTVISSAMTDDNTIIVTERTPFSATNWCHYEWWECIKITGDTTGIRCADGEDVSANVDDRYRNLTILSCIPNFVPNPQSNDTYIFLAKYDNGPIITGATIMDTGDPISLKIPYEFGVTKNITTINDEKIGDCFLSATTSGDFITIRYVMGATLNDDYSPKEGTGILYEETLKYNSGCVETVFIDGIYEAELYYDKIDYDFSKKPFYNEEYKQTLYTNQARILKMELDNVDMYVAKNDSGETIPLLITKDGIEGLQEDPKYDINAVFNRGAGAAWEHHFKLSECNTIEDLENYGNNYFNL